MDQIWSGQVWSGNLISPGLPLARGYFVAPSKEQKIYKIKLKLKVGTDKYNHAEVSLMGVQLKLNKE